jgi:dihydrodipicolinate synthase/N-acetylneuraminate lyase
MQDFTGIWVPLIRPPYYVRPSQAGVEDFFTSIADASPFDLLLYDIPARAGVRIETATGHPRGTGLTGNPVAHDSGDDH